MAGKHIAPPPTFTGGKPKVSEPVEASTETNTIVVKETPIVVDGTSVVVEKEINSEEIIEVSEKVIDSPVIIPVEDALERGLNNSKDTTPESFDEIIESTETVEDSLLKNEVKTVSKKRRVISIIAFALLAIIALVVITYALLSAGVFGSEGQSIVSQSSNFLTQFLPFKS
jgi:hypothetical protein